MTTANLSVGIDTSPARKSLDALKAELKALDGYTVNTPKLQQQIQTGLSQANFKIAVAVNTDMLRKEVEGALRSVLDPKIKRRILIDTETLSLDVAAAIDSVLKEKTLSFDDRHVHFDEGVRKKLISILTKSIGTKGKDGLIVNVNQTELTSQIRTAYAEAINVSSQALMGQMATVFAEASLGRLMKVEVDRVFLSKDMASAVNNSKVRGKIRIHPDEQYFFSTMVAMLGKAVFVATVRADEAYLRESVKRAVDTGLLGVKKRVDPGIPTASAAPSAPPFNPAALTAALVASLTPIMDRIADSVADGMRAAQKGVGGGGGGGGGTRYALSRSAVREDGARLSMRQGVDAAAGAAELAALQAANAQKKLDEEGWRYGPSREDLYRLRDAASVLRSIHAAQSAPKIDPRTLLGLPSRDAMKTEGAQIAAQMRDGVKNETLRAKSALKLDPRVLLGLPTRDEAKALGAQIAAQIRDGVKLETLKAGSAPKLDPRTVLGLPSRSEMQTVGAQIAAQMREQAEFDKQGWEYGPNRDKAAHLRGTYATWQAEQARQAERERQADVDRQARQARQAGARASSAKGAAENAKELEAHRGTLKQWAIAANDVHSAARGLSGAFQMLWLTWGSTAAIAAGAGVGAIFRDVLKGGKDLEYQLAFVSVLTNDASVSVTRFADAVRGSLVAPIQAAEAMRALAQNGLAARDALAVLPDVLALATAGEMSLADAALGATGVMAAFNMRASELGHVGDIFAKAAALSNTSVQQMVEAMRQASTVSDQYNVSLEETAAVLATLAKRNITGSAAGTAFRNMLNELAAPLDKAKEAMKRLDIQIYKGNGQLKEFGDILEQLQAKTATMNEKSRIAFLGDVFGERGAKAINSLLSDVVEYERTLDSLKNKADGFTQSVVEALKATTEGKWRALISEFKLTTADAFESSKQSVKDFIDALRELVNSDGFRTTVKVITEGFLTLGRALTEHGTAIGVLVGAWVVARTGANLLTVSVNTLGIAMGVSTVAAERLTLAARGLSLAFGWIAILGTGLTVLYEWVSRQDAAAEAQKRHRREVDLYADALRQSQKQQEEKLALLDREIELIKQGVEQTKARTTAERDLQRVQAQARVAMAEARLNDAERAYQDAQEAMARRGVSFRMADGTMRPIEPGPEAKAVKVERENLERERAALAQFEEGAGRASLIQQRQQMATALGQLGDFSRRAAAANKQLKKNLFATFTRDQLDALEKDFTSEQVGNLFKALEEDFSKRAPTTYRSKSGKEASAANKAYNAELHAISEALKREEGAAKDSYEFQKKLNALKYEAAGYGPYLKQLLDEQAALDYVTRAIDAETQAINRLMAARTNAKAKGDKDWSEADDTRYATEMSNRLVNRENLKLQLRRDQELARARAEKDTRVDERAAARDLTDVTSKADAYIAKLRISKELRIQDPVLAAQRKAEFDVELQSRDLLKKYEDSITEKMVERTRLAEELGASAVDELGISHANIAAVDAQLAIERARLKVLRDTVRAKAEQAGVTAGDEAAKGRTSQAGWDRFWAEYMESGVSSADYTYKAWKSTTDKMTDAMATFVSGGKVNFKSLVQSIIADLLRLQANQAFRQLFMAAVRMFGGGSVNPNVSGADLDLFYTPNANGNIMTSHGPVALRRYASGGVARSPQLALFGEGSRPEAYVPLPDGRTIPVTMDSKDSKPAVNVTYAPTINVDSTTDRAQVTALIARMTAEGQKQLVTYMREQGIIA